MFPSVKRVVSAIFGASGAPETSADPSRHDAVAECAQDSHDIDQLLDELGAESPRKESSSGDLVPSESLGEGSSPGSQELRHTQESPDVAQVLDELGQDSQSQRSSARVSQPCCPGEYGSSGQAEDGAGLGNTSSYVEDQQHTMSEDPDELALDLVVCSEDARILDALPEWQPGYRPPPLPSSGSLPSGAEGSLQAGGLGSGPTLADDGPVHRQDKESDPPPQRRRRSPRKVPAPTQRGESILPSDEGAAEARGESPPCQDEAVASPEELESRAVVASQDPELEGGEPRAEALVEPSSIQEKTASGTDAGLQAVPSDNSQPQTTDSRAMRSRASMPGSPAAAAAATATAAPQNVGEDEIITISDGTPSSQDKEGGESQSLLSGSDGWLSKKSLGPYRRRKRNLWNPVEAKKKKLGAPTSPAGAGEEKGTEGGDGHASSSRSGRRTKRRESHAACTTGSKKSRRLEGEQKEVDEDDESRLDDGPVAENRGAQSNQHPVSSSLTGPSDMPPSRDGCSPGGGGAVQEFDAGAVENQEQSDHTVQAPAVLNFQFNADDILNYARQIGISVSPFFPRRGSDSQEEDAHLGTDRTIHRPRLPPNGAANQNTVDFTAEEILSYLRQLSMSSAPSLAGQWSRSPRKPGQALRGMTFTAEDILQFQGRLDIPADGSHLHPGQHRGSPPVPLRDNQDPPEHLQGPSPVLEQRCLPSGCAGPGRETCASSLLALRFPQDMRLQMQASFDSLAK